MVVGLRGCCVWSISSNVPLLTILSNCEQSISTASTLDGEVGQELSMTTDGQSGSSRAGGSSLNAGTSVDVGELVLLILKYLGLGRLASLLEAEQHKREYGSNEKKDTDSQSCLSTNTHATTRT